MTDPSGSHAATARADRDPLVGTTLGGRYTIQRVVGWGGMGVVYLALDGEDADREVVIKVLARQLLHDASAQQRFDREAASLKSLRHPNIVEMYGFEREDDHGYIIMEYLDGELLSAYLEGKGALAVEEFVPIAAQILKGAGFAHSREVVLRDLKPDNMMLCERKGRTNFVKMLDFGLAKLLTDDKQITKDGVVGTLGYIAPEVIEGQPADLRADVYALGVMFYRMLANQLPFPPDAQNQAALLYKTVKGDFPALGGLLPGGHDVPEDLVALIHDCLRKDPNDRPADANAVVERLIDAVPASLFRLPQSAVHKGRSAARVARQARPVSGVIQEPTATVPVTNGEAQAEPPSPPSADQISASPGIPEPDETGHGRIGGVWIGVAAAALLMAGIAVGVGLRNDDGGRDPAVKTASPGRASAQPAAGPPATVSEDPSTVAPIDPEDLAEPKPPPAAAPVGPLRVTSTPAGASLSLDDAVLGTTPFEGTAPLGSHVLTVRAEGYDDWTQTVVVAERDDGDDAPASLVAELTASRGKSQRRGRTGRRPRRNPGGTSATDTRPPQTPDKPAITLPSGENKSSRSDALLTETGSGKKGGLLLPGSSK